MIGNGIILVSVAVMVWLIIDWLGEWQKKASRSPEYPERHESLLADGDERMVTQPAAVILPVEQPRYRREINEILTRMEEQEAETEE